MLAHVRGNRIEYLRGLLAGMPKSVGENTTLCTTYSGPKRLSNTSHSKSGVHSSNTTAGRALNVSVHHTCLRGGPGI